MKVAPTPFDITNDGESASGGFFDYHAMRHGQAVASYGRKALRVGLGAPLQGLPRRPNFAVAFTGSEPQTVMSVKGPVADTTVVLTGQLISSLVDLLADMWKQQTRYLSSIEQIYAHPAVEQLVALGKPIVPYAVDKVDEEPELWSFVLHRLTGAVPYGPNVQREDVGRAWREALGFL